MYIYGKTGPRPGIRFGLRAGSGTGARQYLSSFYPLTEVVFVKFIPIDKGRICQVYIH